VKALIEDLSTICGLIITPRVLGFTRSIIIWYAWQTHLLTMTIIYMTCLMHPKREEPVLYRLIIIFKCEAVTHNCCIYRALS